MNTGNVAIGLLVGFATGASLGVLFAPDKGKHTREKISQNRHEYTDRTKKKFNALFDEIAVKFDHLLNEIGMEKSKAVKEVKVKHAKPNLNKSKPNRA